MLFNKIMDYDKGNNRKVYNEILENMEKITPCIGSGLSVSFGYKTWGGFLTDLLNLAAKDEYVSERQKIEIGTLIENNKLEKAASSLASRIGEDRFKRYAKDAFTCKTNREMEAVFMQKELQYIPLLFNNQLILTSNYDTILEYLFASVCVGQAPALARFSPHEYKEFDKAEKEIDFPLIYHFHGSIYRKDTMIITKRDYMKNYHPFALLRNQLRQIYKKRRLLFLGCGLGEDAHFKLLAKSPGGPHYAIIGAPKNEVEKSREFLAGKKVKAIYFPDKKFDCVTIILGRLWLDSGCGAYDTGSRVDEFLASTSGDPTCLRDVWQYSNPYRLIKHLIDVCYTEPDAGAWFNVGNLLPTVSCDKNEVIKMMRYLISVNKYWKESVGDSSKGTFQDEVNEIYRLYTCIKKAQALEKGFEHNAV